MKKNKNPFMNFVFRNRARIEKQHNKKYSLPELIQICDPYWKELTPEQRAAYKDGGGAVLADVSFKINTSILNNSQKNIPKQKRPFKLREEDCENVIMRFIKNCRCNMIQKLDRRFALLSATDYSNAASFLFIDVSVFPGVPCRPNNNNNNNIERTFSRMDLAEHLNYVNEANGDLPVDERKVSYAHAYKVDCIPCEVTVAEYSLLKGVTGVYHSYVNFEEHIPLGFSGPMKTTSEDTHKIGLHGVQGYHTESPAQVAMNLKKFGERSRQFTEKPYVFALAGSIAHVAQSICWLERVSGVATNLHQIGEVEHLLDLSLKVSLSPNIPLINYTVVDSFVNDPNLLYNAGIRCGYHGGEDDETETYHCSMRKVLTVCGLFGRLLCGVYSIKVCEGHEVNRDYIARAGLSLYGSGVSCKKVKVTQQILKSDEKIVVKEEDATETARDGNTTNFDLF